MKKLLITLMLISPFSFADWGDVYYCQMTTHSNLSREGKQLDYKLEKFTFKSDKTKNAMVFGKDGYFGDTEMELREGSSFPAVESWKAEGSYDMASFRKGKFIYASIAIGITQISADCDKF
jgi:hypothetical protein|tara:strand:- start:92 stop:454 length:363 start_codon:yes stop_codon:yes gene_type:complete